MITLKEKLKALNKIRYIAVSGEIIKHDLRDLNQFMDCFFSLVGSDISHLEAYYKMEEIYKEKHGKNKYASYDSFKQIKYRWNKKKS